MFFVSVGALFFYTMFISSPRAFSGEVTIVIQEGLTLSQISKLLKERNLIKSPAVFETLIIALEGQGGARHGEYVFKKPQNVWTIARRIVSADFGLIPVKITLSEGLTVAGMADILEKKLTGFNKDVFVRIAKKDEGYLFPDTYRFFPNAGALEAYKTLRKTFDEKIKLMENDIAKSQKTPRDIVIMASLLEKEARTMETRRTIAGILWKRLSIGMPLQVDAAFEYIIGKNTYTLTTEDLKIDSPYNTYKYKGLPPGPIANPGLGSIEAALNPLESPYFFYLSDKEGNIYYSRTHDEHVIKKSRYIQ